MGDDAVRDGLGDTAGHRRSPFLQRSVAHPQALEQRVAISHGANPRRASAWRSDGTIVRQRSDYADNATAST